MGRAYRYGRERCAVPTAEVCVSAESRSAGIARRFLRDTLRDWDAATYTDTAELVLTELVTNAILHAKTDIVVRVDLSSDVLRLEVVDHSLRQPIARHYSAEATTGRGLALVDALTRRWGVEPEQAGKTVWAEMVADQPAGLVVPVMVDVDLEAWSALGESALGEDVDGRSSGFGPASLNAQRAA